MTLSNESWLYGITCAGLWVAVALLAVATPPGGRRWWSGAVLVGALTLAAQFIPGELPRMLLLDGAELATVALIWLTGTPRAQHAAGLMLALLLPAMAALGGVFVLAGDGTIPAYPLDKGVAALFIVGWGLKLALIPFYVWLPGVAEAAPPLTTALLVSVVDIAAFGEWRAMRTTVPWLFTDYAGLWLALALLSMFGGALLALAQRDLKRLLAFSTIDDLGYLVLGTLIGTEVGLTGALLGALAHGLFKVLLFGAVSVAEGRLGTALTLDRRGLVARYPAAGAAFIVGALGMLGIPPTFGFVGRWRLYLAGAQYGGTALTLALVAATGLALLAYVRAIHRVWLGAPEPEVPAGEPKLAVVVLVVLMAAALGLGLVPVGM